MVAELSLHERFVELVVTASVTVPVNELTGATVIVDFPATPALTVTGVGLAAIVKSCTVNVTVVERDRVPLVPVTPTGTVDADAEVMR